MMTDDEIKARNEGREAGRSLTSFAGQCPYGHTQPSLRIIWMDGFGQGRGDIAARIGAETAAREIENKGE